MSVLTRDQRRAQHAYDRAERALDAGQDHFEQYKTAVHGLGPNTMRSGLSAAMAFLERQQERQAVKALLEDLAEAGIPGLGGCGPELPGRARRLSLSDYMLATRELLRVAQWLKRACQAVSPGRGS